MTMLAALLVAGCGSTPGVGSSPGSPVSHTPPPGSHPPATSTPTLVVPHPGGGRGTPVRPVGLQVGLAGGRAWAQVSWWGGIPSCYVLRPVGIVRAGSRITLTLREGSDAPPGTVCADIAMLKAVRVDLGRLAAGSYTVIAGSRRASLVVPA